MKCGDEHSTRRECKKPATTPPKCADCQGTRREETREEPKNEGQKEGSKKKDVKKTYMQTEMLKGNFQEFQGFYNINYYANTAFGPKYESLISLLSFLYPL